MLWNSIYLPLICFKICSIAIPIGGVMEATNRPLYGKFQPVNVTTEKERKGFEWVSIVPTPQELKPLLFGLDSRPPVLLQVPDPIAVIGEKILENLRDALLAQNKKADDELHLVATVLKDVGKYSIPSAAALEGFLTGSAFEQAERNSTFFRNFLPRPNRADDPFINLPGLLSQFGSELFPSVELVTEILKSPSELLLNILSSFLEHSRGYIQGGSLLTRDKEAALQNDASTLSMSDLPPALQEAIRTAPIVPRGIPVPAVLGLIRMALTLRGQQLAEEAEHKKRDAEEELVRKVGLLNETISKARQHEINLGILEKMLPNNITQGVPAELSANSPNTKRAN